MKGKKIVFINADGNRSIERVALRALISTGSEVELIEKAPDDLSHIQTFDLVIVSYDNTSDQLPISIKNLLNDPKCPPTVVVSEKREKSHLIDLFSHARLRNLIARNEQILEEEMIITVEKLLRKDIFGMKKYFTWGVDFEEHQVTKSSQKQELVATLAQYVETLKCDSRFVHVAEVIADEMIMNALYDAPVGKDGKPLFAHLPRTQKVEIEKPALFQFGCDGRYLGISCVDPFGALKAQTVVQYLRKCFAQDEYQIDQKKGGAGVGFYMIFQSISQLVINIEEGKKTEIIGLIDIRTKYKDAKSKSKSLNIFLAD